MLCFGLFSIANRIFSRAPVVECLRREPNFQNFREGGSFILASQSLISAVNSYDNYIQRKGIDEQVIDAYIDALAVAFRSEQDVQYGLQQSAKAKSYIAQYVKDKTGGRVADLEVYAGGNDTSYKVLEQFYNVLMYESAYLVDSFFYYIEIDEKDPWKRFYFPRRKVLKPVV